MFDEYIRGDITGAYLTVREGQGNAAARFRETFGEDIVRVACAIPLPMPGRAGLWYLVDSWQFSPAERARIVAVELKNQGTCDADWAERFDATADYLDRTRWIRVAASPSVFAFTSRTLDAPLEDELADALVQWLRSEPEAN
jgi:hypothetical protein